MEVGESSVDGSQPNEPMQSRATATAERMDFMNDLT